MVFVSFSVVTQFFGVPSLPARGDYSYFAYRVTLVPDLILTLLLIFFVLDATVCCWLLVHRLCPKPGQLSTDAIVRVDKGRRLPHEVEQEWDNLKFVAGRTRCVGKLIYFPFVLVALLIASRSSIFANYAPSLSILMTQGFALFLVFLSSIFLWLAATKTKARLKEGLMDRIIDANAPAVSGSVVVCRPEQLEALLRRVEELKEGAFSPVLQQPLFRAVLLPLGSFGWAAFVEKGIFPGL